MLGPARIKSFLWGGIIAAVAIAVCFGIGYGVAQSPYFSKPKPGTGSPDESIRPKAENKSEKIRQVSERLAAITLGTKESWSPEIVADAKFLAYQAGEVQTPLALIKAVIVLHHSENSPLIPALLERISTLLPNTPSAETDDIVPQQNYLIWLHHYALYRTQVNDKIPALKELSAEWTALTLDPSLSETTLLEYSLLGEELLDEAIPSLSPSETVSTLRHLIASYKESSFKADPNTTLLLLNNAVKEWQTKRAYPEIASVLGDADQWVATMLSSTPKPNSSQLHLAAGLAGIQATYMESRRDFGKTAEISTREAALWRQVLALDPKDTVAACALREALVRHAGAALSQRQPAPNITEKLCNEALGDNPLAFTLAQPEIAARCEMLLGRSLLQQGKSATALIHLQSARILYEDIIGTTSAPPQANARKTTQQSSSPNRNDLRNALADLDLDYGRALLDAGRYAEAVTSLQRGLEVRRKNLETLSENTRPNLELARYYGRLAEAMEKSGHREQAAEALREKLHFEELAASHSFRAETIQEEMVRTRAWLARLLASGGQNGAVIEQLSERMQLLGEQLVSRPADLPTHTAWLEALGELGRTRIASGAASGLAGDFLRALETLEAIPEARVPEGAAFPLLKIRLFWLQSALLVEAGDVESATQAINRANALLGAMLANANLPTEQRASVAEALCRRGEELLTDRKVRESYQALTQARTFLEPTGNTATAKAYPLLRARILAKLGQIQLQRGHPEPARELLEQAGQSITVLGPTPERAELELETSALLGAALAASGEVTGALNAYTAALNEAEKLWGDAPEQDERRLRLADIWHGKGSAHMDRAEYQDAVDAFRREQRYLLNLARLEADTGKLALPLIRNYRTLAECQLRLGIIDDASRLVDAADSLLNRLPEDRAALPDVLLERIQLHRTTALVRSAEDRTTEANTEIRQAIKLAENPKVFSASEDERSNQLIGLLWLDSATISEKAGETATMINALQDAYHALSQTSRRAAISLTKSESDPREIAGRIAAYYVRQAQPEKAYPWCYEQRNLTAALLREYPKHKALILDMIRLETELAHLAQMQRQFTEAEAHLAEVIAVIDRARDREPNSKEFVTEELHTLRLTADLQVEKGDPVEAIASYEDCWLAYNQKLPEVKRQIPVRIEVAQALVSLAQLASKERNFSSKKTAAMTESRKLLEALRSDPAVIREQLQSVQRLLDELDRIAAPTNS